MDFVINPANTMIILEKFPFEDESLRQKIVKSWRYFVMMMPPAKNQMYFIRIFLFAGDFNERSGIVFTIY